MKTVCALLLFFLALNAFSQDKIIQISKEIIECKIVEIGLDEVKYLESDIENSPVISISVDKVAKIILSNGREIKFSDPLTDPESYTNDRKKALKLHFLSPLLEHLAFSYERSIKPGRSVESSIGFIGLGFNTDTQSKSAGLFLGTGIKFMKTPDFYSKRLKYSHILKGAYIKPEVLLSLYRNTYENYLFGSPSSVEEDRDILAGALAINLGKQIVYDNAFLIDYSIGLGYGFSNQGNINNFDNSDYRSNHFAFIGDDNQFPLALTFRLKIGFLVK